MDTSLIELFAEWGTVGLSIGLAWKLADLAYKAIKTRINQNKSGVEAAEDKAAEIARLAYDQAKTNGANIDKIMIDLSRVLRAIDGNGRPGLLENWAKLATLLDAHIKDLGLHTNPRES